MEARLQDCTVAQTDGGGFFALAGASVLEIGCHTRHNREAGSVVDDGAQMTVAHSSSDGDAAGCVVGGEAGGSGGGDNSWRCTSRTLSFSPVPV